MERAGLSGTESPSRPGRISPSQQNSNAAAGHAGAGLPYCPTVPGAAVPRARRCPGWAACRAGGRGGGRARPPRTAGSGGEGRGNKERTTSSKYQVSRSVRNGLPASGGRSARWGGGGGELLHDSVSGCAGKGTADPRCSRQSLSPLPALPDPSHPAARPPACKAPHHIPPTHT